MKKIEKIKVTNESLRKVMGLASNLHLVMRNTEL